MARSAASFVENQFVQGLITEASGLNFPEKAVIETWNTRYKKTGEVVRRLGYNNETATINTTGDFSNGVRRSFTWKTPGGADKTFVVLQTGYILSFFEPAATGAIVDNLKSFSIDLTDYSSETKASLRRSTASFASAEGKLFIVHPGCDPIYVLYDPDLDTITVTQYKLFIRDFKGVEDNLEVDERPTTLSVEHHYNLMNQGWYHNPGEISLDRVPTAGNTPLTAYYAHWSEYPSNSEIWWLYKTPEDDFDPDKRSINFPSAAQTAKGHFIYEAFNINREEKSGLSGLENEIVEERPSAISFYAGRIWYSGIDDQVYFSQIIKNEKAYGACHQKNDPTDENYSDLLDTDGGVIKILGMGKAVALFSSVSSLFIFATNGIWIVSGSGAEGTGFVATDFSVRRISTTNLLSSDSLVDAEGTPFWWNLEGLWTMQASQQGMQVASISHDTIKTFLDDNCPIANRSYVQGAFNPSERTIQWLFKSETATNTTESYQYDRLLELNLTTGAFYPFSWDIDDMAFSTILIIPNITVEGTSSENVTDSLLNTVTAGGVTVTIQVVDNIGFTSSQYKYVSVSSTTLNVLEENDDTYLDFSSLGTPVDYLSYFISGAKVHAEGREMGVEYITVFANTMTDASAKIQAKWDWTNSSLSGKWSTKQQVYSSQRPYREVSRKRLLLRGSGPAVQLSFTSDTGKPFNIIGWSSFETGATTP